jgi:predicted ester cyclase
MKPAMRAGDAPPRCSRAGRGVRASGVGGVLTRVARATAASGAVLIAALSADCSQPATESNKHKVEQYLEALLIERDWDRWPEFFDASASVNGTPFALQIMHGTAEGLHYSFADMSLEIREQIEEPGRVATLFVIRGRHERPFDAQAPTHLPIELDGFAVDHFRGGKIVASTMILDVWGLSRRVAASRADEH